MSGISITERSLELEVSCPVTVSWRSSSKPTGQVLVNPIPTPASVDFESQKVLSYIQKRYWDTLYYPEFLAPVKYLCLDLLRIRRNPPAVVEMTQGPDDNATEPSTDPATKDDTQLGLNVPANSAQSTGDAPRDTMPLPDGPSRAQKRKMKRDGSTGNASKNSITTPFDTLMLPIVKIEQKHRKAVSAIIQESLAGHYGLSSSLDDQLESLLSPYEAGILRDAIKLRCDSAQAEEDRANISRGIDAEVEHWYQEYQARGHIQEENLDRPTTLNGRNDVSGHKQTHGNEKKLARRQELLKASLALQVRTLREQFERREVLLQIVLLLVVHHLFPSQAVPEVTEEEDEARDLDDALDPDLERRRKKKKKSRTASVSAADKESSKSGRQDRRKNKNARRRSNNNDLDPDEEMEIAHAPEVMLDMLADRIALWHAVGAGSDVTIGSAKNSRSYGAGLEYGVDSDSDEDQEFFGAPSGDGYVKPSKRAAEEWDWVQRFCVNIVEKYFLAVNRSFCESLHLKVFGETLAASEPMDIQDPSIEVDRDDTSVHSFNSGTLGERSRGSFSRAPSVTSLSSSTRMERTMSADPTTGQSLDGMTGAIAEGRNNGKPSIQNTASGNSLSRTTSSTGSSHLFRNRQVGFSRTNSSLLTANSAGPVSIFMGKRKTMVVPLGNRVTATRKVSGESTNVTRQHAPTERGIATGSETLALATPSKPRPKQNGQQTSDSNIYRDQGSFRKMVTVTETSRPSDMFVEETPAIPGGRYRDFRRHASSHNAGASQPSRLFSSADAPYRLHEPNAEDDLADFMVDTDEEDDGALFSGGKSRRPTERVDERTGHTRLVEDVPEVPETPLKPA